MSYCTIIHGGDGYPHAFYPTKEKARAAAKRRAKRHRETIEVVWCNTVGVPKLWLAMVGPDGRITHDDYWDTAGA